MNYKKTMNKKLRKAKHGLNHVFTTLLILPLIFGVSCKKERYADALTPEQAIEDFQIRDGFKVELYASEPHVLDPVEMVFDENGDAYVVEMPDYPYMPDSGKGEGRIRFLRDTDDDGQVDESSIFADKLLDATSILPWKGGLIVTAAPHIIYLKDTNGDYKADTKEVLFSGFFQDNSEAQITSLRFGVDNWIYAANNGQAGEVNYTRVKSDTPLSMRGADFRFRLDRDQFELESGRGQFGHDLNDWGHRFYTQNTIHIQQSVIPYRYLNRHPYLPSKTATKNISDHDLIMHQLTPPPYWRAERTRRRNERYQEQNLDRVEHAEDHFTGSSGGTIYSGDAFPEEYYGNVFTGDVAGNLVHRDVLKPLNDSPTFVAMRDEEENGQEFLASNDSWFRPASLAVGPDGYLYVIDMYRQHIETPISIPEDLQTDMDFYNGMQHGRIYRIVPENKESTEKVAVNLKDAESSEYVQLLSHPNRWWRLNAQRLLLERQDKSVVPEVQKLYRESEDPRVRLHALYVLEGLNSLTSGSVKKAMTDPHPGVREHGMILSERFSELLPQLLKAIDDPSARVAFQATLSLGQFSDEKVTASLANVVNQYGEDQWFRTAVLSSEAGSSVNLLKVLVNKTSFFENVEPWKTKFLEDFSYIIGARQQKEQINSLLDVLSQPAITGKEEFRKSALDGLIKGLKRSGEESDNVKELIQKIEPDLISNVEKAIQDLKIFYSKTNNLQS
jgi:putative membrane-bound dehydrogenase-like protein